MNDFIIIGGALSAAVSLGAVVKFWMDIGVLKHNAEVALRKAEEGAEALAQFRANVAEKYASNQALIDSEKRIAVAMDGMRSDVRDLTSRIDRILSEMQKRSH